MSTIKADAAAELGSPQANPRLSVAAENESRTQIAMKYLCMVYFEGNPFEGLSKDEREALDRSSLAYDEGLKASGNFIAAEALQGPGKAANIRIQGGRPVKADGPVVKSKEYLGGFILITAKDMDEAVLIASKIPVAQYASVEVRPVFEF